MKFYLEVVVQKPLGRRRRAHVLRDKNEPDGGCLCKSPLNLEKWILVEELPQDIHLCRRCKLSLSKTPTG